jgi:hypothetical protein
MILVLMRDVYFWSIVVFGAVALLVGGMFFVFGKDTVNVIVGEKRVVDSDGEIIPDDVLNSEEKIVPYGGAGGGASGGSGGGGGVEGMDPSCERWYPVDYSLGKFFEKIECLVEGDSGCESVKASCGSEVTNLDYSIGGIFSVRNSLISNGEEVGFGVGSENIAARGFVNIGNEILVDGVFDIENLSCIVNVESVPLKCVG